MNGERLGDDFADAHPRIERGEWVLKHHLHLAALRAQLFSAKREKIASLEADFPAIGLDQPQEHARQGGFPAATLADDGKRLATKNGEAHAVNGGETRAVRIL